MQASHIRSSHLVMMKQVEVLVFRMLITMFFRETVSQPLEVPRIQMIRDSF